MHKNFTALLVLLISIFSSPTYGSQTLYLEKELVDTPHLPSECIATTSASSGYGEISSKTGRPKTVHVKGYYRKDGTHVQPHYRSPPRRG